MSRAVKLSDVRDPDFQVRVFKDACRRRGLPDPVVEHQFAPPRKWRFDFAFTAAKVALEIEGGLYIKGGGRHNRAGGFLKDAEKYNRGTVMGWKILRATPQTLCSSVTLTLLVEAHALPR